MSAGMVFFACSRKSAEMRPTVFHSETSDRFCMDGRSYLMDRSALSDFAGYEDMFQPDTIAVGSLPVPGKEGKSDKFYVVQWVCITIHFTCRPSITTGVSRRRSKIRKYCTVSSRN